MENAVTAIAEQTNLKSQISNLRCDDRRGAALREAARFVSRMARTPRRRTLRQFAEEEIVLTSGPYEGRNYSCDRQPFAGLWFDAIDGTGENAESRNSPQNPGIHAGRPPGVNAGAPERRNAGAPERRNAGTPERRNAEAGPWNRFAAVGPSQSGKTVAAFHVPLLYHLFEIRERVICALPDENMAAEKWFLDILPMIQRTRYREFLPGRGGGSRGGKVELIQFGNGAALKFMTAGGDDKSRAHFTARVVVATEVDGMDTASTGSREADPMTQIETRTKAYGDRKRIYLECTASTEEGRIWQEWKAGTASRIALRCPHCGGWHAPEGTPQERKLLTGWEDADDELAARERAAFHCALCGAAWSEAERRVANEQAMLLHRGQSIEPTAVGAFDIQHSAFSILGEPPRTKTLGFRWSAINNLFLSAGEIAAAEWHGKRAGDEEKAERELCQFVWGLPHRSALVDMTPLDQQAIVRRQHNHPRGVAPAWTQWITVGVDLGKWMGWYWAVAWADHGRGAVIEYGRLPLATEELGEQQATRAALLEFADTCAAGWAMPDGQARPVDRVWVDSNYAETRDVVFAVCRERWPIWMPVMGRGGSQYAGTTYRRPRKEGGAVLEVGEGYHFVEQPASNIAVVEIDADVWKSWVQERFAGPADSPGAMTLYSAMPRDHLLAARHLTAERKREEFKAGMGGGLRYRWEKVRGDNHLLDCAYMAAACAHWLGVRLTASAGSGNAETRKAGEALTVRAGLTMPDGRAFMPTERN